MITTVHCMQPWAHPSPYFLCFATRWYNSLITVVISSLCFLLLAPGMFNTFLPWENDFLQNLQCTSLLSEQSVPTL